MIRSILTQLWNCRKANLSVFLELLFVFCLVWYITDYLFVYAYNENLPNHRDLNHTWKLNIDVLSPDHPDYRADESEPQAMYDNFHRILRIVEDYPGVEAVGVSPSISLPGTGNYRGRMLYALSDTTRFADVQQLEIYPGADFFRVFHYTRNDGTQPASVSDFDWATPRPVVISRSVADVLFSSINPVGQKVVPSLDKAAMDAPMTVIGVVDDTKRYSFLRPRHASYPAQTGLENYDISFWRMYIAICIRSNGSQPDVVFLDAFRKAMTRDLNVGNFFFKGTSSFRNLEANTASRHGISSDVKVRVYLMIFFLLNILLCVLGTFWYRINMRRSEIGLRKSLGASQARIRNTLFLEGICLLTVSALCAAFIDMQFVSAGLIETMGKEWGADIDRVLLPDRIWLRFLITNGITYSVLALVILAAIWLPARRAAALMPSDALRDE
ncbi:MAG: ABC transporter permease [Tannerella sp.]|jgi:hypothetical protein|nr:ABC transporter permease [Tannerella sp.]